MMGGGQTEHCNAGASEGGITLRCAYSPARTRKTVPQAPGVRATLRPSLATPGDGGAVLCGESVEVMCRLCGSV